VKFVTNMEQQSNIIKKANGSGGNDEKSNLIEVCRICHTKIHSGNIKLGGLK